MCTRDSLCSLFAGSFIVSIVTANALRSLGEVGLCLELQGIIIIPTPLTGIGDNESEVVDIVMSMVVNARYSQRSDEEHPTRRLLFSRTPVGAEFGC